MSKPENIIGRDYEIDYLDAASDLLDSDDFLHQEMIERGQEEKYANVDGFLDYCVTRWKGGNPISFKDIPAFLSKKQIDDRSYRKRFGILFFYQAQSKFDFVKQDEVIIPRGINVGEIEVPWIQFQSEKEVVTPRMIGKSLEIIAQQIMEHDLKIEYLIGLTHPRLGKLINKKWGFGLEEHPFPEEVYKLIDMSLHREEVEDAENLQAVRNQVLVYKPIEAFFENQGINQGNH